MEISTLKNKNNRTMKILKNIALLFVLIAASLSVTAQKETMTVALSNPGKHYKLRVNLTTGSIKVTGTTGKDIVIEVSDPEQSQGKTRERIRESDESTKKGDLGMKKISMNPGYEITAKENDNTVHVSTSNPNRAITIELKVPQDVTLIVSTVNGGDIDIDNIKGELEVTNVNGDVRLSGISGSAVANTINGDVIVKFNTVDNEAPMAFSTLNGKVDVSFPSAFKSNLKLKSDRGEIYSDFDVEMDKTIPRVNRTASNGLYKLNVDDWVYGKINGGGPQVMMKTMMGNIYVRKNK
jgi:hypothetical protein